MKLLAIVILALSALNFFSLYWKGVKDRNHLRSLLIQILLDGKTYDVQKEGLNKLVLNMDAKNAMEFSQRINSSVDRLVREIGSQTTMAAHALLWEIKKKQSNN